MHWNVVLDLLAFVFLSLVYWSLACNVRDSALFTPTGARSAFRVLWVVGRKAYALSIRVGGSHRTGMESLWLSKFLGLFFLFPQGNFSGASLVVRLELAWENGLPRDQLSAFESPCCPHVKFHMNFGGLLSV